MAQDCLNNVEIVSEDDMLVRYINERSKIYDLEDADFYMQFASKYQNEAYEYLRRK